MVDPKIRIERLLAVSEDNLRDLIAAIKTKKLSAIIKAAEPVIESVALFDEKENKGLQTKKIP